ncbi:hypothetical protein FNV43_RR23471 [Rhamnella rubrinervis]|uniref:Uncharacterized protein n=1 Tax=Rhamnella rubrinervis TaxID=2594499 RepID=A0A8K0DY57_9ROSA|nr:hypothetical protein FNV43_RR23471 [Rhamnella rubrinervis]
MNSLHHTRSISATPNCNSIPFSSISSRLTVPVPAPASISIISSLLIRSSKRPSQSYTLLKSQPRSDPRSNDQEQEVQEDPDARVQDLRVPDHWLDPSRALKESEWLRVTLHKWLDDEYCPEATNVEISKVAALSYYTSLLEKQTDLGEILLKMIIELQSISYQESFHGAFSSANAAVNLIAQRIEQA